MSDDTEVHNYLDQFDRAATDLPVAQRAQLRREIVDHVEEAKLSGQSATDALAELGAPELIVSEATEARPAARRQRGATRIASILVEIFFGWALVILGVPAAVLGAILSHMSTWWSWTGVVFAIGGIVVIVLARRWRRARRP